MPPRALACARSEFSLCQIGHTRHMKPSLQTRCDTHTYLPELRIARYRDRGDAHDVSQTLERVLAQAETNYGCAGNPCLQTRGITREGRLYGIEGSGCNGVEFTVWVFFPPIRLCLRGPYLFLFVQRDWGPGDQCAIFIRGRPRPGPRRPRAPSGIRLCLRDPYLFCVKRSGAR